MQRREFMGRLSVAAACSLAAPSVVHGAAAQRIVDTHTHFYDPTREQGVPWPGKDSKLYRAVYPDDWLEVAAPHGVRETVVVEASPWLEDNQWLLDLARQNKCIVGVVGNLSPHGVDFEKHLRRFAKDPIFRGIRVAGDLTELAGRDDFQRGIGLLSDMDLELDFNGSAKNHAAVAQLARKFPQLRIVLNHVGAAGDPARLTDQWRHGIATLGECQNVFCKISALGEQTEASSRRYGDSPRDVNYYRPILDHCWDSFGEDRLVYGSNWPVCEKGGTYADQLAIVHAFFQEKGQEAAEKYFWKNAQRAYRWPSDNSSAAPVQAGQRRLSATADFEGGSARILDIDQQSGTVRFMPAGTPDRGWTCWWALRLDNVESGQRLTLELNASDQPTRNNGQMTGKPLDASWALAERASLSTDGRTWKHSTPGKRDGSRMLYEVVAESRWLWVAWGPMFTPSTTQEVIASATASLPGASQFTLAKTREGRPVLGLQVGAGDSRRQRPAVWIQARQHAWESGASWVARGLVEWLSTDSPSAKWLLASAEIVVVPIMDVDNVSTGNGGKEADPRDHNRDWDAAPVYSAVAAAQKRLSEYAQQQRLDIFIDLHNPAPRDARPFFFCGPPELLSDVARENRAIFLTIASQNINGPLPVEPKPRITGPSYHPLWRQISGQWVNDHGNPHTLAICLETAWNTPQSTTEGYRSVGSQLGESVVEYLKRRKK